MACYKGCMGRIPSIADAQSHIKDSIIYIANIAKSLRGIDRYSFTENGEIITKQYNFFYYSYFYKYIF
ncbi:hypothetical protein SAMN05421659_110148 [[Clostridium] fimetarium]|uniref:Uncharacterized protein n=1 Tax=[Clostridium] fimetarium TaxID=99656 RepID=A0A1I0R0T5_9FIRM|nr:hypothetical protein SAMN05421659_110148 [[Clostridium] fimetarium]